MNNDRESNLSKYKIECLIDDAKDIIATERLANHMAEEKVISILKSCSDQILHFTDADNGDDLTMSVLEFGRELDNRLVNNVSLVDDCVVLMDENGENFYPYEVDVPYSTLLSYMVAELKRESGWDFVN